MQAPLVLVGQASWLRGPGVPEAAMTAEAEGHSLLLVARDGVLEGWLDVFPATAGAPKQREPASKLMPTTTQFALKYEEWSQEGVARLAERNQPGAGEPHALCRVLAFCARTLSPSNSRIVA